MVSPAPMRTVELPSGTEAAFASLRGSAYCRSKPRRVMASGYEVPAAARPALRRARAGASLRRSAVAALFDLAMLAVLAGVGARAWLAWSPLAAVAVSVAVTVAMTRFLRGLECLVHEASHDNWDRRRPRNDAFANLLAGLPVLTRVQPYRVGHMVHHRNLGSPLDPDAIRYRELGLDELDRSRLLMLVLHVARLVPRSVTSWFAVVGLDRRTAVGSAAWYGVVVSAVALVADPAVAALGLAHVVVAFLGPLPFVRIIGEAEEHRYGDGVTVLDTTVTNVGLVHGLLVHPHGDGYHVEHHLWTNVPHHRLGKLHRELVAVDENGFAARLRVRRRVLETPVDGGQRRS